MEETTELWVRAAISALALALALWEVYRKPPTGTPPHRATPLLLTLAGVAFLVYFSLGSFRPDRDFDYPWEQFHYGLGSKYFAELGYDGLYAASMAAQTESAPERPRPGLLRDLRDNQLVASYGLVEEADRIKQRFAADRWESFRRDHHHLIEAMDDPTLHGVRKDHGYNPTPTWTFVAQCFTRWSDFQPWSRALLGLLDLLLLGTAVTLVWRNFGERTGCWFLVVLGLGYAWRFSWVGGSILRQLWFVSLVAAVCALRRKRFALGGSLVALATMLRIFPGAFLLGPLVVALRDLWQRRDWSWSRRFALGFLLTVVGCLAAGTTTGRGPAAWQEFGRNLDKHRHTWLTNNMGLDVPLLFDIWIRRPFLLTPDPLQPGAGWKEALDTAAQQRRAGKLVFCGALLFLAAGAAWRHGPSEALPLGALAVFALASVTSYYWILLLLLLLRERPGWPLPVLLLCNLIACTLHLRGAALYAVYGLGSWAVLTLLVGYALWLRQGGRWRERVESAGQ